MITTEELNKDEIYVKCETENDLKWWLEKGGWKSIEEFEEEFQVSRDELIGNFFFTWGSSIDIRS